VRRPLAVHHVVKRSQGGSDFDLDLLVALCRWCHDQTDAPYERGRLLVTTLGDGQFSFEVVTRAARERAGGPTRFVLLIRRKADAFRQPSHHRRPTVRRPKYSSPGYQRTHQLSRWHDSQLERPDFALSGTLGASAGARG
jgi:hypothetical protein